MQFKLSFNKPAYEMFFAGEAAAGVQIRVTPEGAVHFHPSPDQEGEDVVPIQDRSRGGIEAVVDGPLTELILKHMRNPHGNPFFMISRVPGGWMEAKPYDGVGDPPRFKPQLRVWTRSEPNPNEVFAKEGSSPDMPSFMDEIRAAKAAIEEYAQLKKVGRPPVEISVARRKIRAFEIFAQEILSFDKVWDAYRKLGDYLGVEEHRPKEEGDDEAADEEAQVPAQAADTEALAKRGRGRPRKEQPVEAPPEPKKRGRPRKSQDDEVVVQG